MRSSLLFTLSAAIASVSAATNLTSCCNVDPATVDPNYRLAWCRAQQNTCPLICPNGQATANTCDSDTLEYTCTCASGATPNISDYGQTLPSLECDNWKGQCVNASANNLAGQNFCLSFICGSKNASASSAPGTTTGAGGASATTSGSASGTSQTATTTSKGAAAVIRAGQDYGTGALLLGVFAMFGFAL